MFVQVDPFDHVKDILKKISNFNGKDHFFSLLDKFCRVRGVRRGVQKIKPTIIEREIIELGRNIFLDEISDLRCSHGAQFIVSKEAIVFHAKLTYQKILDFIIEGGVTIQRKPTRNSFSPWDMELIWVTLFDQKHKTFYD